MINNYISVNILYLLKKSNLSQEDFGSFFELGKGLISNYIHERALPKVETIQRICFHFEITIDDFINKDLGSKVESKHTVIDTPGGAVSISLKYVELLENTIEDKKKIIQSLEDKLTTKEIPNGTAVRDGLKIIDEIENVSSKKLIK